MTEQTVVLSATFTAEPVRDPLAFLLRTINMPVKIDLTPYNQVFQQLLDPGSACRSNKVGINIFLVRFEDWGRFEIGESNNSVIPPDVCKNVERSVGDFVSALRSAASSSSVPYLVIICPPSQAALGDPQLKECLGQMELFVECEFADIKAVHLVRPDAVATAYPVSEYDDPEGNRLGHLPYTPLFFVALGAVIARKIHRLKNVSRKVIALDCDQTLWSGICGEDGPLGIELDEPRLALQKFMVSQHNSGMLLCLCSKNNEEDVFEVFDRRPEMPLTREHIVASKINWRAKSENLRSLASELNLGLDSFIFVDDDPVVCSEVEANCPEVLTLLLPGTPTEIVPFLNHVWAFDQLKATAEDQERTGLYLANLERERLRSNSQSLDGFLTGLGLEIDIFPLHRDQIARVSQLTQRTNQFNFTTIRRSEFEIEQLSRNGERECQVVKVTDRFGDYGLVGVVVFQEQHQSLEVETFLLSCRVLGRGVEHRILAHLGMLAQQRGLENLRLNYIQTAKNRPAFQFISQVAAEETKSPDGGRVFVLPAQVAATTRFATGQQPTLSPSPVAQETTTVVASEGADDHRVGSSVFVKIARELRTAEQIYDLLKAEKTATREVKTAFVATQDKFESTLKTIWEGVLQVAPIGADDNYFELGGDSFQAVRIFSEIEKNFGRHLPLVTLLAAPTVKQLAALLREKTSEKLWSPLVPIQPQGSRPPLYCMHAAGGDVLFYRDLAKYLGLDQPLYGLRARGVNRTETPHNSVEEMASYYLDEIRAFQPEGPYYLGGSSFGGLVAFEMARQLEQQGQAAGLLALFDTYGPGYPKLIGNSMTLPRMSRALIERARMVWGSLVLLEPRAKVQYLITKAEKARKKLKRKFTWKKNEIAMKFSSATGRPLPRDIQRNHKAIAQALSDYRPQPYSGRLTLFRAERQPVGILPDRSLGWGGLSAGLEIHEVPGFHGAVTVDPYAKFLAEKLAPCLLAAQQYHGERLSTGHVPEQLKIDRFDGRELIYSA